MATAEIVIEKVSKVYKAESRTPVFALQETTLTVAQGTWTGVEPISYAHRWERCDAEGHSCVAVTGIEGEAAYVLTEADEGHTIQVRESATNAETEARQAQAKEAERADAESKALAATKKALNDVEAQRSRAEAIVQRPKDFDAECRGVLRQLEVALRETYFHPSKVPTSVTGDEERAMPQQQQQQQQEPTL